MSLAAGDRRASSTTVKREAEGKKTRMQLMSGAVGALLLFEAVLLTLWFLSIAFAYAIVQPPSVRASRTARERGLARLPQFIRPPGAAVPQRSALPGRAWQQFEQRWWGAARTADAASDRAFALPSWLAAGLLIVAVAFLVDAALTTPDLVRRYWAVPTFLLLLNFSVFATTVALQQRAWLKRAPFEWQLILLVGVHAQLLRSARRSGEPAEMVEERVITASRRIERLLRNRFSTTSTSASERAADSAWVLRLQPLLDARTRRILAPDPSPPAVWFAEWVDTIATALQHPALPSASAEQTPEAPLPADPMPRIPVISLWALTAVVAGAGVLTSPLAASAFTHADWKSVGAVVAVVVGIATCVNYGVSWYRRGTGRT